MVLPILLRLLIGAVQALLACVWGGLFLGKPQRPVWVLLLSCVAASALLFGLNQLGSPLVNTVSTLVVFCLLLVFSFPTNKKKALLVGVVGITVQVLCEIGSSLLVAAVQQMTITDVIAQTLSEIIVTSFSSLLFFFLILLVRMLLQRRARQGKPFPLLYHLTLLFIPLISMFYGYYIAFATQFTSHPFISVGGFVLYVSFILLDISLIFVNEKGRREATLREELSRQEMQKQRAVELIRLQENHLEALNAQAHDFKYRLATIQHMATQEMTPAQRSDLGRQIEIFRQEAGSITRFPNVEHPTLRTMLVMLAGNCARYGVKFAPDINYSRFGFMENGDLVAIFSNAFSNAIEACLKLPNEGERYLRFSCLRRQNVVAITFENAKTNPVLQESGVYLSTKDESGGRGYGLQNLMHAVRKYDGDTSVRYDAGSFTLTVLLPVPMGQ